MCFNKAKYLLFADKVDFFKVPQHLLIYVIQQDHKITYQAA